MINNDKELEDSAIPVNTDSAKSTPDENSGLVVQGFIKIFDPESGKVLVHTRA